MNAPDPQAVALEAADQQQDDLAQQEEQNHDDAMELAAAPGLSNHFNKETT